MSLCISSSLTRFVVAALLFMQLSALVHAWQECEVTIVIIEIDNGNNICPSDSSGDWYCSRPTSLRDEFLKEHCQLVPSDDDDMQHALFHNCSPDGNKRVDCCLGAKSSNPSLSLVKAEAVTDVSVDLEFNFVVSDFEDESLLSVRWVYGAQSASKDAYLTTGVLVRDCSNTETMRAGSFRLTLSDLPQETEIAVEIFDSDERPLWTNVFEVEKEKKFTYGLEVTDDLKKAGLLSENVQDIGSVTATPTVSSTTTTPTLTPTFSPTTLTPTLTPSTATPTLSIKTESPTASNTTTTPTTRRPTSQPTSDTPTSSPNKSPTIISAATSENGSMTVVYASAGGALLLMSTMALFVVKGPGKRKSRDKLRRNSLSSYEIDWEYAIDNPLRDTSVAAAASTHIGRNGGSDMPRKLEEANLPVATPV